MCMYIYTYVYVCIYIHVYIHIFIHIHTCGTHLRCGAGLEQSKSINQIGAHIHIKRLVLWRICEYLVVDVPVHMSPSHTRLHYTATHCNTLQHTATQCNTLQHTATHMNWPFFWRICEYLVVDVPVHMSHSH